MRQIQMDIGKIDRRGKDSYQGKMNTKQACLRYIMI